MIAFLQLVSDRRLTFMTSTLLLLVFFMQLSPKSVFAERYTAVNALMDEPESLFDIGMLKLREESMRQWESRIMPVLILYNMEIQNISDGSVVCNLDNNRITISLVLTGKP
jgi:hypothetical protein